MHGAGTKLPRPQDVMTLQQPRIPPIAVVLRVVSILGMGLTVSGCVLALVAAEWWWAIGTALGFLPFLAMMALVDRLIPDLESWNPDNQSRED